LQAVSSILRVGGTAAKQPAYTKLLSPSLISKTIHCVFSPTLQTACSVADQHNIEDDNKGCCMAVHRLYGIVSQQRFNEG